MRIAALYDVHGNLPALEAVLADPRCAEADVVVCGGDLVLGPSPAECLDRLEAHGGDVRWVMGNCDRAVSKPEAGDELEPAIRWCAERLGEERLVRIRRWPVTVELEDDGRTVLFCHATPTSDTPILTRLTPEEDVARELGGVDADLVVCGHTHVQYDRGIGRVRLVNAGSVGMPYEATPDARWALLGGGEVVELVATPYDASAARETLVATGFPLAEQWFPDLEERISAEEATASFESRRGA